MNKNYKSNERQLISQSMVNLIGRIINQSLQLVIIVIISRYLGVYRYGVFSLALTIYSLSFIIAKMGVDSTILRFIGIYYIDPEKNRALIAGTIFLALIVILVSSFTFFIMIALLGKQFIADTIFSIPLLSSALLLISIALPFALILEVLSKAAIAMKNIYPQFLFRYISVPLLRLTGILLLLWSSIPTSLDMVIIIYSSAMIPSALLICLYFILTKPKLIKIKITNIQWRKFLNFAIPSFTLGLSMTLFNYSDLIMLGILFDPQEVGIYSASKNFAFNLSIINISLVTIYSPMVAGFFSLRDLKSIRKSYRLITTLNYILNMPAFLLIFVFPTVFLTIMGAGFTSGNHTLMILGACYFLNGFMLHSQYTVLMTGHAKTSFYYYSLALVLNIFLNYLLIPDFGSAGAAMATFFSIIVLNIFFIRKTIKIAQVNPFPEHILKYSLIFFSLFGIYKAIDYLINVNLLIVIIIGIMSYLFLILTITFFDQSLKNNLYSIFKNHRQSKKNKLINLKNI